MSELKPCPFCGGAAKLKFRDDGRLSVFVQCKSCWAKSLTIIKYPYMGRKDAQDAAIEAWNRRVKDD